ncbi:beta-phosphoglucomutase [Gorillibacterium timonense]|uniref:beta-phosphoglucomutase n=1 Tax=Gorillibacterium timonense TaxID=1689269 RepID=UPI00071DAA5D|nr:beta-phosphoglucomutase [Gorillibacterium timonense]
MNERLTAVIFDLDGVIADTNDLYDRANRRLAAELGTNVTDEENDSFKGIHRSRIVRAIAAKAELELTESETVELGERKNRYYQEMIEALSPRDALPGIPRFLEELCEADIRLGLASSSSNAWFVLERLGLTAYFDAVADPRAVAAKPAPDLFLAAARLLDADPVRCAAVEDGEAGLAAIRATPMFSVGVGSAPYLRAADWNPLSTAELSCPELLRRFSEQRRGEPGGR